MSFSPNDSAGRRSSPLVVIAPLLLTALVQARPASPPFHFTSIDEKLLEEVNDLDKRLEQKGMIYRDPKMQDYLDQIGARLVGKDGAPERVVFKFRVLRDPMVNAFALPNGSVYVNTGLLAAMDNQAQLAFVLSHEITHVTDRHSYQQNRNTRKKAVATDVIAGAAAAAAHFPIGPLFGSVVTFASSVSQMIVIATVFGYSQDLEREADRDGYARMTAAGYDGAAMARALAFLDERLEFEPVKPFWRTHPKLQDRIAVARKLGAEKNTRGAFAQLDPRDTDEREYLGSVVSVIRYNIALDLESRRPRTAVARAGRLVNWAPNDSLNQTLLADAYRSLGAKTPKPGEAEYSKGELEADRKRILKLTEEEEQRVLLALPAGSSALAANQTKAETLYRDAIASDPSLPDPHRGLAMLYENQTKNSDASHEYREYLRLAAPNAIDRLRIERRIEKLK